MSIIDQFVLVRGMGHAARHRACLMSAQSVLDGREFSDKHPSDALRAYGIRLNDSSSLWRDNAHRTAIFRPVLESGVLCASRVLVTPELELRRAFRCADVACRVWAPRALEAAGLPDHAAQMRALAPIVDRKTAMEAVGLATADAADAAWAARAVAEAAWEAAVVSEIAAARSVWAAERASMAMVTAGVAASYSKHAEIIAEAVSLLIELAEMRD